MTLKILGETTWEKTKVGEVFAWNGCWQIYVKTGDGNYDYQMLASDSGADYHIYNGYTGFSPAHIGINHCFPIYKLSLATQRLFRQDT